MVLTKSTMPSKGHIESLNALSIPDFRTKYWSPNTCITDPSHLNWPTTLESSSTISSEDLSSCFKLIEYTSSKQYAESSSGWHPIRKRKEMRLPDIKYLMVKMGSKEKSDLDLLLSEGKELDGELKSFVSFMLTYEDGIEVIYCYELHLAPGWRGMGMGKFLMAHVEEVGRKAGVKKSMLTVFRANQAARGFYERMGYEEDEYSPRPKKLRGGVVKEADYIILSKSLVKEANSVDIHGLANADGKKEKLKGNQSRKRSAG